MNEEYLWDRSGPPDPEMVRLEALLGRYRLPERSVVLLVEQPRPSIWTSLWVPKRMLAGALATVIVVAGLMAGVMMMLRPPDWKLVSSSGSVEISEVATGGQVRTHHGSQVRLQVSGIGDVTITGDSLVRLAQSEKDRRRMVLEYGTLHARIVARPGVFVVETPATRAVDLGCEFTLQLDRQGNGSMQVFDGWVQLEYGEDESVTPKGAMVIVAGGNRGTPPFFPDASPAFQKALRDWTFGRTLESDRAAALDILLREARQRDALTLLNLFRHASIEQRHLIFDRLNQLVPAPYGTTRGQVAQFKIGVLDPWWSAVVRSLGLEFMKKQKRINLRAIWN